MRSFNGFLSMNASSLLSVSCFSLTLYLFRIADNYLHFSLIGEIETGLIELR